MFEEYQVKSKLFFCFALVVSFFCNYLQAMEKDGLRILSGTHSEQSKRKYQEDTYCNDDTQRVYCVFDGHGGGKVSEYLKENFNPIFSKKKGYIPWRLKVAFEECEKHCVVENFRSGSTAVVAAMGVDNKNLHVVNIGDSRFVFGKKNSKGIYEVAHETKDHKPGQKDEKSRIEKFLPNEIVMVPWRYPGDKKTTYTIVKCPLVEWESILKEKKVKFYNKDKKYYNCNDLNDDCGYAFFRKAFANFSRSIGDVDWKQYRNVITAEPDIYTIPLQPEDEEFAVLATDGLWDVMSSKEATKIVGKHIKKLPSDIAKILCTKALKKGTRDNVTATVLKFLHDDWDN